MQAAPWVDIYQQILRRRVREYEAITSKTEKTAFLSGIVTDLVNRGLTFIQKDGERFYRYNMNTAKAFAIVRGKVRQAMMDFSRKELKRCEAVQAIPGIKLDGLQNEELFFPEKI